MVIPGAFFPADRAQALHPFIRPGVYLDLQMFMFLTKSVDINHYLFTIADMHTIVVEV